VRLWGNGLGRPEDAFSRLPSYNLIGFLMVCGTASYANVA
jgi:hypothetical protein